MHAVHAEVHSKQHSVEIHHFFGAASGLLLLHHLHSHQSAEANGFSAAHSMSADDGECDDGIRPLPPDGNHLLDQQTELRGRSLLLDLLRVQSGVHPILGAHGLARLLVLVPQGRRHG